MIAAATRKNLIRLIPDWLVGAFCLAIPALYNSYPLLTSDSGAYIGNGYDLQVPLDRPISYSVFVRLSSMGVSLWGVVAVQVLVLSLLMLVIARHFLGPAYRRSSFSAIMLLIGVATSCGWFAGQIMPDIFTAILLLVCIILAVIPLSRITSVVLYILMLGCILMHNSNLLISLLLGIILFVYCLWKKERTAMRRTAVALVITSVIGWLSLSAMTAIAGRGFRPSVASHVFLMSRMVENGIMDDFLDDYCPTDSNAYKLCAYRGHLPRRQWDFMWDEAGPLYATGGWQANEAEYNGIILKTLTTPKYLALHIIKATHATLRQLPLIYAGDGIMIFDYVSSPQRELYNHLKGEQKEFNSSEQQTGGIRFSAWNYLITVFALLSCCSALLLKKAPAARGISATMRRVVRITLLFLLVNASVTATLATVIGRYESRVFWILPFLSILYIVRSLHRGDEPAAS